MTKQLNKKGTSLVELIAVIIIMGIIAGVAIPTTIAVIDRQKTNAAKNSAQNIMAAAEPVLLEANATPDNLPDGVSKVETTDTVAAGDDGQFKILVDDLAEYGHLKENPITSTNKSSVYIYIDSTNKCHWSETSITISGKTIDPTTISSTTTTTTSGA